MICAKFGWYWSSGSEEEDENVKSLWRQNNKDGQKLWSEKLTWAFSSGELKKEKVGIISVSVVTIVADL